MSIHTPLTDEEARDWLMLYNVGAFKQLTPARGSSSNTVYLVTTDQGRYVLRVAERRRFRDLVYEKDALVFLADAGLSFEIPRIQPNVINGYLTPVFHERYASLFCIVDGRALGRWEIEPGHCAQLGRALGEMHARGTGFKGYRRHPENVDHTLAQLRSITQAPDEELRFAEAAGRDLGGLRRDLAARVPHALLHGEPTPEHARFRRGQLRGLIDFERVARGPAVYDLGQALVTWGLGDDETLNSDRCQALLDGYQQQRALRPQEGRTLWAWACYAALVTAVEQLVRYELREHTEGQRFKDYRAAARRWNAVHTRGRRGFARDCGLSPGL
ncbi:MAG: phosphotransferase [Pseudomonadota bacterium]